MAKAAEEKKATKAEKVKATTAEVSSSTGALIRTYTLADHGENFEELAAEFVSHTPGTVVSVH